MGFFQLTQPEGIRLIQRCKQQARSRRSESAPTTARTARPRPAAPRLRSYMTCGYPVGALQGFHPHDDAPSGNPLYADAGHVALDERAGYTVLDMR